MTDQQEINQLITWAESQGIEVAIVTGEASIYENGDSCYQIGNESPMSPIYFAERMRKMQHEAANA